MPLETVCLRRENVAIGQGRMDMYFYYDNEYDEWLSVHENTLVHARNATNYTGFLRSINGVQESSTHGPIVPYDAKIVWVSANAENTPDVPINIYSAGASLGGLGSSWDASEKTWSVDFDIAVGENISVQLSTGIFTYPNRPIVTTAFRWRLT